MVKRELKVKYRGTVLGYLWSMLNPLLSMLIISFVFSHLVKDIPNYNLYVLSGVLLWSMGLVSLHIGTQSIVNSASLLRKIKLPIWIFPLIPLGSSCINLLLAFVPYAIFFIHAGLGIPDHWYWFPFVIASYVLFLAGISLALSSLNVFFRDIQHVLEPVLSLVFYATPIIYDRKGPHIPPEVANLLGFNPFTHYIEVFRETIFKSGSVQTSQIWILTLLPVISIIVGVVIFRSSKRKILFRI